MSHHQQLALKRVQGTGLPSAGEADKDMIAIVEKTSAKYDDMMKTISR